MSAANKKTWGPESEARARLAKTRASGRDLFGTYNASLYGKANKALRELMKMEPRRVLGQPVEGFSLNDVAIQVKWDGSKNFRLAISVQLEHLKAKKLLTRKRDELREWRYTFTPKALALIAAAEAALASAPAQANLETNHS